MASPLRPQFFCTRPNGTVTPLIAVDELPSHIAIRGVSRALSANDTQGMTSLGTVNGRNQSYVVDGVPTVPMRSASGAGARSRDYDLQNSLLRILSDESIPANQRLALHSLIQQALGPSWAVAGNPPAPAASNWLAPATSGGAGSKQSPSYNVKKEFCSYWIRHGECDYQQQGCLYKHEMPTDPSMLEKLGLRDIPRWYREKYGVPSLLPGASHAARSQIWKDDVVDSSFVKSIQYPSRPRFNGSPATPSDTEKPLKPKSNHAPAIQHGNVAVYPAGPRASYGSVNSPKVPGSRHGSKTASQQSLTSPSTVRKIDLLSFDPMPDYPTFDSLHGNMPGMAHPASDSGSNNANNRASEDAHREGIVRNLQTLMPGSTEYLPGPLDSSPPPQRTRKSQKPRRLYQPRSQIVVPGDGQESASFRNQQHHQHHHQQQQQQQQQSNNNYSSAASAASKGTNGSQMSPIGVLGGGGLSSDPPTRVASPSIHSATSLSSQSSPRVYCNRNNEKEPKLLPGTIGNKRNYRKRSTNSSEEDLFDLGVESGTGHGSEK